MWASDEDLEKIERDQAVAVWLLERLGNGVGLVGHWLSLVV